MYNCYTSYISSKRIQHKDVFKIPVCRRIYCNGGYSDWYRDLAPEDKDLNWLHDQPVKTKPVKEHFTEQYLNKLNSLKADGTLDRYVVDIRQRLQYADVFLLCYEKPREFCHRHILARFLSDHYDLPIEEY